MCKTAQISCPMCGEGAGGYQCRSHTSPPFSKDRRPAHAGATGDTERVIFPFYGNVWCSAPRVGSSLAGRPSELGPAPEVQVESQHETPRHGRCDRTPSSHRPEEAFNVTLQSGCFFKSINFNCMSLNYKQHMIFFVWKTSEQNIRVLQHFIRALALN